MKQSLIARNKYVSFGRYRIIGTRITIVDIRSRHRAGESIKSLMEDYDLTREQIKAALDFRKAK